MAEKYDMPILFFYHPRYRKQLEASGFVLGKRVIQHEPLGLHDYSCMQESYRADQVGLPGVLLLGLRRNER